MFSDEDKETLIRLDERTRNMYDHLQKLNGKVAEHERIIRSSNLEQLQDSIKILYTDIEELDSTILNVKDTISGNSNFWKGVIKASVLIFGFLGTIIGFLVAIIAADWFPSLFTNVTGNP